VTQYATSFQLTSDSHTCIFLCIISITSTYVHTQIHKQSKKCQVQWLGAQFSIFCFWILLYHHHTRNPHRFCYWNVHNACEKAYKICKPIISDLPFSIFKEPQLVIMPENICSSVPPVAISKIAFLSHVILFFNTYKAELIHSVFRLCGLLTLTTKLFYITVFINKKTEMENHGVHIRCHSIWLINIRKWVFAQFQE